MVRNCNGISYYFVGSAQNRLLYVDNWMTAGKFLASTIMINNYLREK